MNTYLDGFLSTKANNTKIAYKTNIEQMLDYINKPLEDITYGDLVDYREHFQVNYSYNSMAQKIRCINAYFDYLYAERQVIESNPTYDRNNKKLRPVKFNGIKEEKEQVYYTMDDIKALIEASKNSRDKAIIATYVSTGIRVNELINLTLEDYNKKFVKIITKGHKPRYIEFNDTLCGYIDEYLKTRKDTDNNNLFISNQGTPMTRSALNKTLKCIAKRAGLNCDIHNHSLRATAITEVMRNSDLKTAQEWVNHSSANTTLRYLRTTEEDVHNMYNALGNALA